MRDSKITTYKRKIATFLIAFLMSYNFAVVYGGDIEFSGGIEAQVDYTLDGSLWIYDANVMMVEPAHILGFVITGSGAVLDIYGGQIDYMLLVSTSDDTLPEGQVTVYGTDFAVNGVPVDPGTTELFLQSDVLSGVYENGTPFNYIVDCAISGNANYVYYQTVKLGWVISEPDIEISQYDYDFGGTDIGTTQTGVLTVYNLGNEALTIQSLDILQDQQSLDMLQNQNIQFAFTPLQVMPVTLAPNTAMDVEILYTPVVEGLAQATLQLTSDDPDQPVLQVALAGEGIPVVLSSQQQMTQLLDVFNVAVQENQLQGLGNKRSAENKLKTFAKMLTLANELIANGYDDYALETLLVIEAKCDGQKSPADFIEGSAAADLNILVNTLIETLQNQSS